MTNIQGILDQHRRWLSQADGMVSQELEFLEEDLASDSLQGLDNVSDSLAMLAVFYGIQGTVAVSEADSDGWGLVSRSILYRYWALMLKAKSFSNTRFLSGIKTVPNLTNQLSNAGCLLAAFIAADRRDLAASVADVLVGMLSVPGAVDAARIKGRRFEPFMVWLYSKYSNTQMPLDIEPAQWGAYAQVVHQWPQADTMGSVIVELEKYHLANIDDKGGAWDPEFKHSPFDVFAIEVGALYRVRQQLGLQTPAVDTRLLGGAETLLGNLTFTPDDVIERVENAYNTFFS